jgi:serine/threonine protein kinase
MTELTGRVLQSRYRVDAFLGRGGMADVYKVWDQQRAVYLAMKVLHADLAEDRVFLRRFKREADTLAKLQHPHIVRSYGLETDGRIAFILMDYIEGENLRTRIFDRNRPFTPEEVLEIMQPVCAALHYAHQSGIVHCDIKPANIMIHKSGNVLVSDFGISRITEAATATMVGAGTPAYMSPEQARGEDLTPQSDIYSLGIVLYEMLSGGERPFTGERASVTGGTAEKVRWEQMNATPSPLRQANRGISVALDAVVMSFLQKAPAYRPGNALDALNALAQVIGSAAPERLPLAPAPMAIAQPSVAGKSPTQEKPQTYPLVSSTIETKLPVLIAGAVIVIVFLLIAGGISLFSGNLAQPVNTAALSPSIIATNIPTSVSTKVPTSVPTQTSIPTQTQTPVPTPFGGGGAIVYSVDFAIYKFDVVNQQEIQLVDSNQLDGYSLGFSWSPDNQQIVFQLGFHPPNTAIMMMNSDGSDLRTIHKDECRNWFPNWSPNGEKILFSSDDVCLNKMYTMSPDGSSVTPVTNFVGSAPTWSPDGSLIAFQSNQDGNFDIYVVNSDGTNIKKLTNDPDDQMSPIWSPDGKKLAFTWVKGTDSQIYTMNVDGSGQINLSNNSFNEHVESWSPDGKQILFSSNRSEDYEIYVLDITNGDVVQLPIRSNALSPSWSHFDVTNSSAEIKSPTPASAVKARANELLAFVQKAVNSSGQVSDVLIKNAKLVYGPVDGEIEQKEDGYVDLEWADGEYKNFILHTTFENPETQWDYGFFFRYGSGSHYRFTLLSDATWTIGLMHTHVISSMNMRQYIDTKPGDTNTILLIVSDGQCYVFINGQYDRSASLSHQESGDIGVATNLWFGNAATGSETKYQDFTIWELP